MCVLKPKLDVHFCFKSSEDTPSWPRVGSDRSEHQKGLAAKARVTPVHQGLNAAN